MMHDAAIVPPLRRHVVPVDLDTAARRLLEAIPACPSSCDSSRRDVDSDADTVDEDCPGLRQALSRYAAAA
jgi:hypothetical protein